MKAEINVTSKGLKELANRFSGVEKKLDKLGRKSKRVGGESGKAFAAMGKKLLAVGVGVAGLNKILSKGKEILDWNQRLGILQGKLKETTPYMVNLRKEMISLSTDTGLTKDSILDAVMVLQDAGGFVKGLYPDMKQLAKYSRATGAALEDLTKLDISFFESGMNKIERMDALAKLNAQADAGKISISALAKEMGALLKLGSALGYKGVKGVEEIGRTYQVLGQVSKSPEIGATMTKALARDITDKEKLKKLQKFLGKEDPIVSKEGTLKYGLADIVLKVLKKTGGKMLSSKGGKGFGEFFTADSIQAVAAFATAYNKDTKDWDKDAPIQKILKSDIGVGVKTLEDQFRLATQGIAKESDQVSKAMNQLDNATTRLGQTMVNTMSDLISGQKSWSDVLADRMVHEYRTLNTDKKTKREKVRDSLLNQANIYKTLGKRGIKSFETKPGIKVPLTQKEVTKKLKERSLKEGVVLHEGTPIIKELRAILSQLKSNKGVVVKPAGGLDRKDIKAGRGVPQ